MSVSQYINNSMQQNPSVLPQIVQIFAEIYEIRTIIIALKRTHYVCINSQIDATIKIVLIISISSTCFGR